MKSLQVCKFLLRPYTSEYGKQHMETLKEELPQIYENMMDLKNKFDIIYNDLLKFEGFISILKADRDIYQRRIEIRKRKNQDTLVDELILNRIKSQLELLGEED